MNQKVDYCRRSQGNANKLISYVAAHSSTSGNRYQRLQFLHQPFAIHYQHSCRYSGSLTWPYIFWGAMVIIALAVLGIYLIYKAITADKDQRYHY
ncbi:MAG: hypothetical protein U5J63_11770 [Fodinibius sp.]|nr:hypothetical protein [Fodinibius sp.]